MKWVYIVTFAVYDEHQNICVYADEKRAKKYAAYRNRKNTESGNFYVEGFEIIP